MKKIIIATLITLCASLTSCKKNNNSIDDEPYSPVPIALRGNWMYGNFSMTEYWSQNPADYIGNAFEMAMAFQFFANGKYEQYFTSKTVSGGITTYHQSLSKGTVEVNEATQTLITHASTAHYKQTKNNVTIQDRDLDESEITKNTMYTYQAATQPDRTKIIQLKMNGTTAPLAFSQKF